MAALRRNAGQMITQVYTRLGSESRVGFREESKRAQQTPMDPEKCRDE